MSAAQLGYAYDPLFLEHDQPGHPEHAGRLRAIMNLLSAKGMLAEMRQLAIPPATFEELCELHAPDYVSQVYAVCERGGGALNGDTYVRPASFDAAALAAGAAMRCASAVVSGDVRRAFAIVRPPGHHAFADHGEGFCLFNNVAFAARAALGKGRHGDAMWSPSARRSHAQAHPRAMIVDFDVHHGNGTQSIFFDDPEVLVLSLHQYGFIYPGSGHHEEVGHGAGRGHTVNVPMPAGAGDGLYGRAFAEIVAPSARRFKPDVLLMSAGFDAHWRDPLAHIQLSLTGLAGIVQTMCDLSDELCGGRLIGILEGGYDLEVLSYGVLNTLRIMAGTPEAVEDPIGPATQPDTRDQRVIDAVRRVHDIN